MTSLQDNQKQLTWNSVHRVVIKVGTSVVTAGGNEVSKTQVEPLVRSISRLKREGRQVVLVSSGAVGLGAGKLGLDRARLADLSTRQACAAVGQSLLMHAFEKLFSDENVPIAQVLLTEDDFSDRHRHRNLRRTMEKLLKLGVLPIINENDTVSTVELELSSDGPDRSFGDNDRLAALVMSKLEADALVLLTNVDGLLQRNGREELEVVPLITESTSSVLSLAAGASTTGRGGMRTKLEAAEIAMRTGGLAIIANGTRPDTLDQIFSGAEIGTSFVSGARLKGKRRWIAYAAEVRGRLVVNPGARDAIVGGKASLLASGVLRIEDEFESSEVVSIVDADGDEIARGMANCNSREAQQIILSLQSDSDSTRVGSRGRVLVTRDNIVVLKK